MLNKDRVKSEVINPDNQLELFGFKRYFDSFSKLYKNNDLPNIVMLNGNKGSGKTTFVYHFLNYILSADEEEKYSLSNFKINEDNKSYKLIKNNLHPNFYALKNDDNNENVRLEHTHGLLKFLRKTSYKSENKFVLIDNSDNLSVNISNLLLNVLEKESYNTFFFIINNSTSKVLETISSRSIKFNFFFTVEEKYLIIKSLLNQYNIKIDEGKLSNLLTFESHGNLIKYIIFFHNADMDFNDDKIGCINYLLNNYVSSNNPELINLASFFIEIYYQDIFLKKNANLHKHFFERSLILNQISNLKKYNLDKKLLIMSVQKILEDEKK